MRLEKRFVTSSGVRTKNLTSRYLRRTGISLAFWSFVALSGILSPPAGAQEVLPFPPTPSASTPGLTMQDSIYKKRVDPKHLPPDAPNILIILMDDVGPGQASTYGGEIATPTLTRIAQLGISYNAFHSTAMCSPVGDLNNDQNQDLAVIDYEASFVQILLGNGDGSFGPPQANAVGLNPFAVKIADFDGDGIPDLATSDWGINSVSLLRGHGDGTFGTAHNFPIGAGPEYMAAGNLNGDKRPDLAVPLSGANQVAVVLNPGK